MEILNQFGINPILLAAQVVNFLILLFILKKFLYGPILKILENRKKTIEQSLKNAEEIELQLQKTKEQSEKIIADTLKEAQKILDQTKEVAAQMIADTNKDAEQILLQAQEDGKKIIELQKVQMMEQLKGNLSGIVELGLEKVWGRKINAEQKKVIEEVVKES
ncbi:F0F1 ATP synthase subunit B [Candidatus Daviesbacteria bacterium]|nr:F0F1 ATP synthase subunit B [Candidatus Daviesbacteria bacterium]